jgi:peptidoglycan hydrolase CwlO-like protein/3D (Asp-Asp-Asp) domain-containing protein
MISSSRRAPRAIAAAAIAASLAATAPGPAAATDLDALRARAQRLGDEVTVLEHRLEELRDRQRTLEGEIATVTRDIGALELTRRDAGAAERAAEEAFIADAVEIYKSGSSMGNLDLILSARNVSDLELFLAVGGAAARRAEEMLRRAARERERAEEAQLRLDERKQRLISSQQRVAAVTTDIEETLARRRATLRRLAEEIERLERQARRAAAAAADPAGAFDRLLSGGGKPLRGIPDGYTSTGVSFEGIASWYGPGFEGNPTASGAIFDPSKLTAASKELPLGTWLYVEHEGRGVVVLVNDRGPYIDGRILDLSQAAAETIGITGLGWVYAEILVKR